MEPLELAGVAIKIRINNDLSLAVLGGRGRAIWETSRVLPPTLVVRSGDGEPTPVVLSNAESTVSDFKDRSFRGCTIHLTNIGGFDVAIDLTVAIDVTADELMVEAGPVGGADTVISIEHLYRFEKLVADGGYMVVPHGSGYIIPADCPHALPGEGDERGLIGGRWSMPLFGITRGAAGMCAIIESWWDCDVSFEHTPGDRSAFDINWASSLGELAYPRRVLLCFAPDMDYVAMSKRYREYARETSLLRTLQEKAEETPIIRRDVESILFRWPAWNPDRVDEVLGQVRAIREMGLDVTFFFPKWSSAGYAPERGTANTANSGWQCFLLDTPVPGGWSSLVDYAARIRDLGCTIQGFVCPRGQDEDGPDFDGNRWPRDADCRVIDDLSTHDVFDRMVRGLDNLEEQGLKFDTLYYDGFSAYYPLVEDFSETHRVTRRETFEAQNACFAETRRRGIRPAAELARFWCIGDCDYFFFTDWSSDRLSNTPNQGASYPVGEPVPLFQLVFHDCFGAGFSGGGYAAYTAGYDWWASCMPRLYELLFASAPAYNWLPDGDVPIINLTGDMMKRKCAWLKRWSAFYRAVAMSEMVSHQFLSDDRKQHRVKYANGITAEFDMSQNLCRIEGVDAFTGEWEPPADDLGSYPIAPEPAVE